MEPALDCSGPVSMSMGNWVSLFCTQSARKAALQERSHQRRSAEPQVTPISNGREVRPYACLQPMDPRLSDHSPPGLRAAACAFYGKGPLATSTNLPPWEPPSPQPPAAASTPEASGSVLSFPTSPPMGPPGKTMPGPLPKSATTGPSKPQSRSFPVRMPYRLVSWVTLQLLHIPLTVEQLVQQAVNWGLLTMTGWTLLNMKKAVAWDLQQQPPNGILTLDSNGLVGLREWSDAPSPGITSPVAPKGGAQPPLTVSPAAPATRSAPKSHSPAAKRTMEETATYWATPPSKRCRQAPTWMASGDWVTSGPGPMQT